MEDINIVAICLSSLFGFIVGCATTAFLFVSYRKAELKRQQNINKFIEQSIHAGKVE